MGRRAQHFYEFGQFRLEAEERLLLRGGQPVPLTPKAFEMLRVLVENHGRIVEKDELMQAVWPDAFVEETNLTRNIFTLRKILGEASDASAYIETVPKRGYRFVAGVREWWDEGADLLVQERVRTEITFEEEGRSDGATGGRGDEAKEDLFNSPTRFLSPPLSRPHATLRWRVPPSPRRPVALLRHWGLPTLAAGVALLGLALAGFYFSRSGREQKTNLTVRSMAVLPFRPLEADGGDEYLGLGMADALITRLSNLRQIVVRPTSAVRKYTGQRLDPVQAGRELKVDSVLEGSVQKLGERVRVTVQLVSVEAGGPIWAEKFDERLTDLFAVEDSISERVAGALALKLSAGERAQLTKRYTENAEAYELYLKGRYFWNKRTEEALKKAIACFEQAIRLDSNYALAYTGLADSYLQLPTYSDTTPSQETYPKAKAAATKALELDETLAEAHTSLAFTSDRHEWNWPVAERAYRRALDLSPHDAAAHHRYGMHLLARGRFDEALAELQQAQALDPLSLVINMNLAMRFLFAGQSDAAIAQLQKAIELDPNFPPAHEILGLAYEEKGMDEAAIAEYLRASTLSGDSASNTAALKERSRVSGLRGYWQQRLELLLEAAQHSYISPFYLARIYARLGEKEQALTWLERAYAERNVDMMTLKVDPSYDRLRADARFADLLRRVGLAQ